jgi:Cu(I)/Ag(I) efflux system membrane fusion protein
MKTMSKFVILLLSVLILGTVGYVGWHKFTGGHAHEKERKVLFYQDSMHPWIKSDKPGKCTVCGMDLTPIYEGQQSFGGDNVVALSSNNITVLNVQTEEVKRQSLRRILRVAGTIDANEMKKTIISAPAAGRIEETDIDYAGVEVHEGQRLLVFYSPELSQTKFRYLFRAQHATSQRDPTGGLAPQKAESDPYYSDLVSPLSGTVIERKVSRGQYVSEGERLFTIADASVLWYRFDVYEQQLSWLRPGQKVMVSLPAIPGKVFEAVISFIDPMLDTDTRTVKVRADISNPIVEMDGVKQRIFKFGMYAEGVVQADLPNRLAVPRTAVLHPGKSAYVYVDKGGGAYERRLITLGQQGDELCEVLGGLEQGERVATSGNVLLDAQAQFAQNEAREEGDTNAMDLTPATIVRLPVVATMPRNPVDKVAAKAMDQAPAGKLPDTDAQALTNSSLAGTATNKTALTPTSSARSRRRAPIGPASPDATSGRMLEGPMYVRMAELRNEELAEARTAKAAATNKLTESQCQSLNAFLSEASGVSQALAADDFKLFNETMTKLPALVSHAQAELGDTAPWADLIKSLAEAVKSSPAKDLAEARKQFLPFSTATVELTKQLRKNNPAFADLKVYHCPMAPQPGLWMQEKGPLANPFYGSQMLTCGEEVK